MNEDKKIKLILGSASPSRKKLLEDIGLIFDVVTADIDEKQIRSNDFNELVLLLAEAKLKAILENNNFDSNTIIITSDFVASYNGALREKPENKEEVINWHQEYSNSEVLCHCSVLVHHVGLNKTLKAVENTTVKWDKIPENVILQIADDPKTYKGAGFTERAFFHYTKSIEGNIDTVLGLPIKHTENFLQEFGYKL